MWGGRHPPKRQGAVPNPVSCGRGKTSANSGFVGGGGGVSEFASPQMQLPSAPGCFRGIRASTQAILGLPSVDLAGGGWISRERLVWNQMSNVQGTLGHPQHPTTITSGLDVPRACHMGSTRRNRPQARTRYREQHRYSKTPGRSTVGALSFLRH